MLFPILEKDTRPSYSIQISTLSHRNQSFLNRQNEHKKRLLVFNQYFLRKKLI